MWRSNYHEDWERRKTYLIRSLFQDIPVLSPVPEGRESRSGAGSPSDIPSSRPHSPLPPLIIERMPDRHDHPNKFYQELEIKMKKLHRKLFFNKGSSSVEDLIETYGDFDSASINDNISDTQDFGTGNGIVSTAPLSEKRSQCYSSSTQESPTQICPDKNTSIFVYDDLIPIDRVSRSNSLQSSRSVDAESSTHSLCQTQFKTVVEVHIEPSSDHDNTLQSIHHEISPVLEYQRIGYNKTISQRDMCQEENEGQRDFGSHRISETETSVSENEDSSNQISSSEKLHKSIEVMRRQKNTFSLGSLHNEPFATPSSNRSSYCINVELSKNISIEQLENNVSGESQHVTGTSLSSAIFEFNNALTTSTPKSEEHTDTRSSSESSQAVRRVRSKHDKENDISNVLTKKRKCESIALQTSFTSDEGSGEDVINWNQLKKNFFVGIPRIYKLCPCNDHACRNKV